MIYRLPAGLQIRTRYGGICNVLYRTCTDWTQCVGTRVSFEDGELGNRRLS